MNSLMLTYLFILDILCALLTATFHRFPKYVLPVILGMTFLVIISVVCVR